MKSPNPSHAGLQRVRNMALTFAIEEIKSYSRAEPHRIFYLYAIRCPGCKRHTIGTAVKVVDNVAEPKPKYLLATVMGGEVVPRRRH